MKRIVLGTFLALGAVLSLPNNSQAAARYGRMGIAGAGSTVFTASFGKGLQGWSRANATHWKVSAGKTVTFNGQHDELLAPFSTAKLHDYAVQAQIKAVGKPFQTTSGYGVVVRARTPTTGITGGSVTSDNPEYNLPLLIWGSNSVGGAAATLTTGYNLIRIDVHGSDYTLSINGTHIVSFTITGTGAAGTFARVGIWAAYQKIQVKSLSVTRLGVVTPLTTRPPVQAVNLAPADLPSGLQSLGNSYFTDEELAQLNNVSADSITSSGLLLSQQTSYGSSTTPASGPYAAFSYVYAYSTPETAAAGLSNDVSNEQTAKGQEPNFSASAVTDVGNEAHAMMYDFTETGTSTPFKGTIVSIFFRRGAYEVTLFEDFVAGTVSSVDMLSQTTALAKIVDARIQRLG